MTSRQRIAERLWEELAGLSKIYGTVDAESPAPWRITIEPWTVAAATDSPTVSVLWNDWPTGEIGPDYAEIYAPGYDDAARQLRRDLHEHIHQHRRLRRIPSQELLIPYL